MNILEMREIYKAFPGVVALDHVTLELEKGEVMALLGENGAGKSTLMKILSGAYHADEGQIILEGRQISGYTTQEAIDMGISIVYQELNNIPGISVAENLFLNNLPTKGPAKTIDYKKLYADSEALLKRVGLNNVDPKASLGTLSVAEKQLVEIAKAVSKNVKILVMDEPTSALNDAETDNLFELILKMRDEGVSIVYISHRMSEIYRVADSAMVMRDGKYIAKVKVADTTTDDLVAYMVGRKIDDMYPKRSVTPGKEVFAVEHLTTDRLKDISFHIRAGEVVGLFGLMGAGRSEIASCIVGMKYHQTSEMRINGEKYVPVSPANALKHKITYVPAERKTDGLFLALTVRENITISNLNLFTKHGKMDLKKEKKIADEWIKTLHVKTPKSETIIESLSGGNQQKVAVAKSLITDPELIILNEPTRGIDVSAKAEIYMLINELCAQGKAVLMISSELPEIMSMSDRIYVICEGRMTGEVQKADFTQELLVKYAIGETD